MANQTPIRILAVDDHALLRKGIRLLIGTESDIHLVAEASAGREGVQEFRTHRPDMGGSGRLRVGLVSRFTRFAISAVRRLQGFHESEIAFHQGTRRRQ